MQFSSVAQALVLHATSHATVLLDVRIINVPPGATKGHATPAHWLSASLALAEELPCKFHAVVNDIQNHQSAHCFASKCYIAEYLQIVLSFQSASFVKYSRLLVLLISSLNALHVKLVFHPIGSLQTAIMRHAPSMFAILEGALLVSSPAIKFPHFVDTFAKPRVTRRFSFGLMLRRWSEWGLGNPNKPPVWKWNNYLVHLAMWVIEWWHNLFQDENK